MDFHPDPGEVILEVTRPCHPPLGWPPVLLDGRVVRFRRHGDTIHETQYIEPGRYRFQLIPFVAPGESTAHVRGNAAVRRAKELNAHTGVWHLAALLEHCFNGTRVVFPEGWQEYTIVLPGTVVGTSARPGSLKKHLLRFLPPFPSQVVRPLVPVNFSTGFWTDNRFIRAERL